MGRRMLQSLIKTMIRESDYLPVRDNEGRLVTDRPYTALIKNSFGSFVIVELFDADRMTAEEIGTKLAGNIKAVSDMKNMPAQYFMEVFLFGTTPSKEKRQAIAAGQYKNVMEKKYLNCMCVYLTDMSVEKLFKAPASDFGLAKLMKKAVEEYKAEFGAAEAETGAGASAEQAGLQEAENGIHFEVAGAQVAEAVSQDAEAGLQVSDAGAQDAETVSQVAEAGLQVSDAGNKYADLYDEEIDKLVQLKEAEYKIEFKVKVPVLTYSLIGINILVGALILLYSKMTGTAYSQLLIEFGAKVNTNILSGEYWRLLTPVFLHANAVHLLINCYSLYAVGTMVEKLFGRYRFMVVYFIAGIMGNIASFVFSANAGVGASGAIFGLLGTLLYFGLEKPVLFKAYFGVNVITTIIINLGYGFSNSGIDNFAHIGGLAGGFMASGIVAAEAQKKSPQKWYFNRYLYLALTLILAFTGILYGFNGKQSRITAAVTELENLQNTEDWAAVETKAEELLDMKVSDKNTRAEVLWLVAVAEANNGKLDEAEEHAKVLVDIDPANGHYILGVIYFETMRYELAKQQLQLAKTAGADNEYIDQMLTEIEGN
ncbi:MAG: rhomboid family intramembrane serine protease [Clostridiales bacterium]|nr:rhomboid family intramembrane serine protease [Clostridiales bacterium]